MRLRAGCCWGHAVWGAGGGAVCELDGRVLGGMQFAVLAEVLFCGIDGQVLGVM